MPRTKQMRDDRQESDDVTAKFRRLLCLTLLLASLVLFLTMSGRSSGGSPTPTALAAESPADEFATRGSQTLPASCLEHVSWPQAFKIPFTMHFRRNVVKQPWPGNLLQYQYAETKGLSNAKFKSVFPKCPNLPGVPLSFFGQPCEFYMLRDPNNEGQYAAYVYSTTPRKKYFLLAVNLGPPARDFVARYYATLPECSSAPLPKSRLPVPSPVGVDWFQTSGTAKSPAHPIMQGYYAAMTKTVTVDNEEYKPPYSFVGAVPGFLQPLVYAQLVYDPSQFVINPAFEPGTFTPPTTGYSQIAGSNWPQGAMTCPVCHLSEPGSKLKFFTETRRPSKQK